MQREGIRTLNIYGTLQEPLWKTVYFGYKRCIQNKMVEMRKEVFFTNFSPTAVAIL